MDCVQESTALAAGAALISAGMTISARLRTEQLSIFFDCRVWSNRAIAGLTGTGWGWDRHWADLITHAFLGQVVLRLIPQVGLFSCA